jgi:hypothetical protein
MGSSHRIQKNSSLVHTNHIVVIDIMFNAKAINFGNHSFLLCVPVNWTTSLLNSFEYDFRRFLTLESPLSQDSSVPAGRFPLFALLAAATINLLSANQNHNRFTLSYQLELRRVEQR